MGSDIDGPAVARNAVLTVVGLLLVALTLIALPDDSATGTLAARWVRCALPGVASAPCFIAGAYGFQRVAARLDRADDDRPPR